MRIEQDVTQSGTTTVTKFLSDQNGNVFADLNASNQVQALRVYLDAVNAAMARINSDGSEYWYLADHLGSTRGLMNSSGSLSDNITYDAFGNVTSESAPSVGDRLKFAGGTLDSTTGLYYFGARSYSPATASWLSQDPLGLAPDSNPYRYVSNQATGMTDPSGLCGAGGINPNGAAACGWALRVLGMAGTTLARAASAVWQVASTVYRGGQMIIRLINTTTGAVRTVIVAIATQISQQAQSTWQFLYSWLTSCFAAGTPVLTPHGEKLIEEVKKGDPVLSAREDDPYGVPEAKHVEEVFVNVSPVLNLHVGGLVIRTTPEHPFYVQGRGWIPAAMLEAGDLLRSHDGQRLPVEALTNSGEVTTVYNLRVADYHTYFVGSARWGFSVWSHNLMCAGWNHFVPRFMGNQMPYGTQFLNAIQHTRLHLAMNRWIAQYEMIYRRSNITNFSLESRMQALYWFYLNYQNGRFLPFFLTELQEALDGGLLH
jgi:RHS repeat-associated protein